MGRAVVLGVLMAASLAALMQPAHAGNASRLAYGMKILTAPSSGDERAFRTTFQHGAQDVSNRLYGALASLLGGTAPDLNFVEAGSPLTPGDLSANVVGAPGAPQGTINIDPAAVQALIDDGSPYHSSAVNALPHEDAHLHQTQQTLADLIAREGGAQAFTDLVTPTVAPRAHVAYDGGNYDGPYADAVAQARQRGRDWILYGQFGRPPTPWP